MPPRLAFAENARTFGGSVSGTANRAKIVWFVSSLTVQVSDVPHEPLQPRNLAPAPGAATSAIVVPSSTSLVQTGPQSIPAPPT